MDIYKSIHTIIYISSKVGSVWIVCPEYVLVGDEHNTYVISPNYENKYCLYIHTYIHCINPLSCSVNIVGQVKNNIK